MIKSFKKGSYRISLTTVLFITLFSAVTLTNASGRALPATGIIEPVRALDSFFPERDYLSYNRLDQVMKTADFSFEVPSLLPDGFRFAEGNVMRSTGSKLFNHVRLVFNADQGMYPNQQFTFEAAEFRGGENMTALTKDSSKKLFPPATIAEKDVTVKGLPVRVIYATANGEVKEASYLWERGGITYKLTARTDGLLEPRLADWIGAVKLPEEHMKATYINPDMLTVDVIDAEDLNLAAAAIGFAPKFPLKVSDFTLTNSFLTRKVNFSAKNAGARVLYSQYEGPVVAEGQARQGFILLQTKNAGEFAAFKAARQAVFNRIDGGGELAAPVSIKSINGTEVLITAPYNISPDLEPGTMKTERTSYFWTDSTGYYQAVFNKGEVASRESLLAELIKAPHIEFEIPK